MAIDDKIRDEKLQLGINKEAVTTSTLLSGKIDKYEYFTGEEILPSDQSRIKEQTTIMDKIFETSSTFYVKYRTMGKF